ncbi:MAG TPA: hypothetical protein PK668_21930 [Myxococcota bacterium]|nr:hypothetical protein [Myxococcota bacterium]HRY96365.1 hypothetical protein [Myxococcota bacterium]
MRRATFTLACALGLALFGCYPDEAGDGRAELQLDLQRLGVTLDDAGLDAWLGWLDTRAGLGQLTRPLEYDLLPDTAPFYLDLVLRGRGPYGPPVLVGDSVTSPDDSTLDVSLYLGACQGCSLELLLFATSLEGEVTTFTGVSAEFDVQAFGAARTLDLDAFPLRTGSLLVRGGEPGLLVAAQDEASEVRFPPADFPVAAGELVLGSIPVGRPFHVQAFDPILGDWVTQVPDVTLDAAGEQRVVQLP